MSLLQLALNPSGYFRRKQQQEDLATLQGALPGLMGEQGWEQAGPWQPGSQEAGLMAARGSGPMIGGSGLMGGEGLSDPNRRAQFAGGLMALPGMQGAGASMMQNTFNNLDANARFSASLQQQAAQQQAQLAAQQQARLNPFSDPSKLAPELRAQEAAFMKQAAPIREQIGRVNALTETITAAGGFNNMDQAQDLALMTAFNKGQRPTEAQMADDIALIMENIGIPNAVERAAQIATGKGMLPAPVREYLYNQTVAQANSQVGQLTEYRGQRQKSLEAVGLGDYSGQVMPSAAKVDVYQGPAAQNMYERMLTGGENGPIGAFSPGGIFGPGGLLGPPAPEGPQAGDTREVDGKIYVWVPDE